MLTEVKAYSSLPSAPELLLSDTGRAETDLIQIYNIDGLDPIKASVNTSSFGAIDGSFFTGSNVASRNIVLTIHPNPDWDTWTYESIRKLLYMYFMPKSSVRLVFESDDIVPVQIDGIVESISPDLFSKDPEFQVSIICPDPYFISVDPVIMRGGSVRAGGATLDIDYKGNVETGVYVKLEYGAAPLPTSIGIQLGDPAYTFFRLVGGITPTKYFEMSSLPMNKIVRNVETTSGVITNLLSKVEEGSSWPTIVPGHNHFSVYTDAGSQSWELRYHERFGGL